MYAEHFSLANTPYGIASSAAHPTKAVVTRLQNDVVSLDMLAETGLFSNLSEDMVALSQISRSENSMYR